MTKNTGKVREFCQSGKVGTLKVLIQIFNFTSQFNNGKFLMLQKFK